MARHLARVLVVLILSAGAVTAQTTPQIETLLNRLNALPFMDLTWNSITVEPDRLTYHDLTASLSRADAEGVIAMGDLVVLDPGTADERALIPDFIDITASRDTPTGPQTLEGSFDITEGVLILPPDAEATAFTLQIAAIDGQLIAIDDAETELALTAESIMTRARITDDSVAVQNNSIDASAAILRIDSETRAEDSAPLSFSLRVNDPRATTEGTRQDATSALTASAVAFETDVPGLPTPIALQSGAAAYGLTTVQDGDGAPIMTSLTADVADYDLSQDLWEALDPGSLLDRAPGQIALDITATTRAPLSPANLTDLTINAADITIAGMTVRGVGDLKTTPPGTSPEGAIDIHVTGVLTLLSVMAQNGLIQPTQAFGAQFVLGLFAVENPAPDSYKIPIRMGADGAFLVNGQRLR